MSSTPQLRYRWLLLLVVLTIGIAIGRFLAGTDHAHDDAAQGHAEGHDDHDDMPRLTLTSRQRATADLGIGPVGRGGGGDSRLSGKVEPSLAGRSIVASAVAGRIESVTVAPGMPVAAGALLMTLVSADAAAIRADHDAAEAQAEAMRLALRRDEHLAEQGIVAQQELEASRARALSAAAAAAAARARMSLAGLPSADGRIRISSPSAGVVETVHVAPGDHLAAGTQLAEIRDPARNELHFSVPATQVAGLTLDMPLQVEAAGGRLAARITGISTDNHLRSGAATVRAAAEPGQVLPPAGTPVAATVITQAVGGRLTVPADAVQTLDGRSVLFIVDGDDFVAVPIRTGRRAGTQVEVLAGLAGDEQVVTRNAFLLKAELAKGEASHDH